MDLPTFRSGDKLTAQHLQRLSSAIRAATIQKGIGYTFERTSAGTRLRIDQGSGGGGSGSSSLNSSLLPFQIVSGYPNPQAPEFPVVRVHGESYISMIETGGIYPITGDPGLGAIIGSEDDNEDDPGQFPLPEIGHSIWLELTTNAFSVTSASIWHGLAGVDGWENYPDPIEITPPTEENPAPTAIKSRCIIAHVVDAADPRKGTVYSVGSGEGAETRKVLQQLRTNLGIQVLMMRGVPCPVLVPWHGPFIIE